MTHKRRQQPTKHNGKRPALPAASDHIQIARADLVHDWNVSEGKDPLAFRAGAILDESLRDGIQSPSVVDPTTDEKLRLVQLMEDIGISAADIGLPGAGPRAHADVLAIANYIRDHKLALEPTCAARTVVADIAAVAEVVQKSGQPIEVYTFIGSSPIRQFAENWPLEHILSTSSTAIDFAVKQGLETCYVTEDTTRTPPDSLRKLFRNAIDHGATRLCLCDTTGQATPQGATNLVTWTRKLIRRLGVKVAVDWHGHNDRGLALINAMAAMAAGADRVHGCGIGIGERVGNTPIDLLILNLYLLGIYPHDVSRLVEYVRTVSQATRMPIPKNYPLSGEDAFRTATGVHAAAIIKAKALGDDWLGDRVYSSVPARVFGKQQIIEIGPMSGMSNVRFWLQTHGHPVTEEICKGILARAKSSNRTLSEAEILEAIRTTGSAADRVRA
jgi:2-isopropylmalate synthase